MRFELFELFFALLVLSELRSWALLLLALQSREELVLLLALLEALLALFVLLEDLLLALRASAFCFPSVSPPLLILLFTGSIHDIRGPIRSFFDYGEREDACAGRIF